MARWSSWDSDPTLSRAPRAPRHGLRASGNGGLIFTRSLRAARDVAPRGAPAVGTHCVGAPSIEPSWKVRRGAATKRGHAERCCGAR